eukprot:scaffold7936_cov116-Isochrysis_galbana.AAC.3
MDHSQHLFPISRRATPRCFTAVVGWRRRLEPHEPSAIRAKVGCQPVCMRLCLLLAVCAYFGYAVAVAVTAPIYTLYSCAIYSHHGRTENININYITKNELCIQIQRPASSVHEVCI